MKFNESQEVPEEATGLVNFIEHLIVVMVAKLEDADDRRHIEF